MQMTADTKNAAFRFAGLLFVALAFSADAAGQSRGPSDFLERRMTPCDFIDWKDASGRTVKAPIAQFQHGTQSLTRVEQGYRDNLRRHLRNKPFEVQKECAYDFMRLRRKVVETASSVRSETAFNHLADLKRRPAAYVGRPIVLYGRIGGLNRSNAVNSEVTAQLVALTTNDIVATVDVVDPRNAPRKFPAEGFNVRIVGFLVKTLENGIPYVCTRHIEWLGVEADPGAYRAVRHKTRGIRPEESSAYYETLVRSRILPLADQQAAAARLLGQRIETRFADAQNVHANERRQAEQVRLTDQTKANDLVRAADGKLLAEQRRHDEYAANSAKFPIFADVFMNPNAYLGKPVTMRGHVRKVMSYPADVDRFGAEKTLHELWLFTNDSQQNPAVIVCSELPANFPTSDEVVEGVSVTGYFFKLYRYAADDANRAAPMLLASQVQWTPIKNTYAGFGSFGTLATVLAMFAGVMLLMYMWSNHDGDRRAREALATGRAMDANPTERPVRFPSPETLPPSTARATRSSNVGEPLAPRQQTLPPRRTTRSTTAQAGSSSIVPPARQTGEIPQRPLPSTTPPPRRSSTTGNMGLNSLPGGPRVEQPLPPRRGSTPINPVSQPRDMGQRAVDGVADSIGGAAGQVGNFVGDQAGRARDFVGDKASNAADYVSDTTGRVTDAAGRVGDFVGDQAGRAGNFVNDQAGRVGDAIGEQAGRVGDFVGDRVGQAGDIVGQQKDRLGNFVGRQKGKLAAAAGAAGAFIAGSQSQEPEQTRRGQRDRVQRPVTGNSILPDHIVGTEVLRVLESTSTTGGSRIELSSGSTLVLNNDAISLQDSRNHDGRSDRRFQQLEGARVNHVAHDQWERVYLLVGRDTFVTEDFAENGQRCLIFGNLSSLVAEEPDLTLTDYWTKAPLR